MGFKTNEVSKWTIENLELPITPHEFEKQLLVLYEELFPQSQLLPGDKTINSQLITLSIYFALCRFRKCIQANISSNSI